MIQKETWTSVTDNTNVKWLKVFHLYKGYKRRFTYPGFFVKGSARSVKPPRIEYKGFKFDFNKKGDICRGLLVRTSYNNKKKDGSSVKFFENSIILLNKMNMPKSKYILGPAPRILNRKKYLLLFKSII